MTSPIEPSESADSGPIMDREIEVLAIALNRVAIARDPELASALTRAFTAVAAEASRTPRFANALIAAFRESVDQPGANVKPKRANRRPPGPFDPFEVFAEDKVAGLRRRLQDLELEQLRDIIAEHRMDNDRLAMKWKDVDRVIDRIIDRVAARAEKGSAFR